MTKTFLGLNGFVTSSSLAVQTPTSFGNVVHRTEFDPRIRRIRDYSLFGRPNAYICIEQNLIRLIFLFSFLFQHYSYKVHGFYIITTNSQ